MTRSRVRVRWRDDCRDWVMIRYSAYAYNTVLHSVHNISGYKHVVYTRGCSMLMWREKKENMSLTLGFMILHSSSRPKSLQRCFNLTACLETVVCLGGLRSKVGSSAQLNSPPTIMWLTENDDILAINSEKKSSNVLGV